MAAKQRTANTRRPIRKGKRTVSLDIPEELFNAIAQGAALEFRDFTKQTLQLLVEALRARGATITLPLATYQREQERITHSGTTTLIEGGPHDGQE